MYKVFIADDEEYVVKSLMKNVNWKAYGFEVIASSNDGIDACGDILKLKPHLVFTDIRMPGMNGLELIKKAKAELPGTLFVVISGYAEFAYAQKAMNYGAIGFCLKPFDDEIDNLLKKAKTMLDSSNQEELDIITAIEDQSPGSKLQLAALLRQKGIEVEKGMAVAVSLGAERICFRESADYLSVKIGSSKYLYFLSCKNQADYGYAIDERRMEDIKGIGISGIFFSMDALEKNIDEAMVQAYQFFITGERGIYHRKDDGQKLTESVMKEFEKTMSRMDFEAVGKLLDTAQTYFKRGNLNIKHAMSIYNVYITFSSHFFEIDRYDEYIYGFDQLCNVFRNADDMLKSIKEDMHNSVMKHEGMAKKEIKNEYFKKVIDYVDQNFYKDISVQSLSKEFVINSNYISQLFRKNTNMTFTDYVTRLRIEYSKELLKKTDISIEEIAGKSGYTDYFYFIRVFKKTTGKAPGQFRHMKSEDK